MPFYFKWLCELLQDLESNRFKKAATDSRSTNPDIQVIVAWFDRHRTQIPRHGDAAVAFLSSLFPKRRPDRVYALQRKRLASIFGRSLGLGTGRMKQLNGWQEKGGADFPRCVEVIMAQAEFAEPSNGDEVTLAELDQAFDEIAARSPFSSSKIRSKDDPREASVILSPILRRLRSTEAKWLIRVLLKNFSPVDVPEPIAMDQFHFLLREVISIQNSLEATVAILSRAHIRQIPPRPSRDCQAALRLGIMNELIPQCGVMIQRPVYHKARSIKHCCDMASGRRISLERKYDGEYCQVHVNLEDPEQCIQIFSKSGKDSTDDRVRLHSSIKESLRLSSARCEFKKHCILEGELLVYNRRKRTIEPFYKIRKHVQRSGRWLGNLADSPPSLDEHLMIIFYDILLLDDNVYLREPHSRRRRKLELLVSVVPGHAEIGVREVIDFTSRRAPNQLRDSFAKAITQRWEGFVLKGCNDPYLPGADGGRCIKLKKDYMNGVGDTADVVIIGGRRDAETEEALGLGHLSWTMFYLACLENKEEYAQSGAKPLFRVIDVLSGPHSIPKEDIVFLNERGNFLKIPFTNPGEHLDVMFEQRSMHRPTELFKQAFVVEVLGSGFEKLANSAHFTLRFPRVLKIHSDRAITETVSFNELQQLAKRTYEVPQYAASQEDQEWIAALERAEPRSRYIVDKSQSTTPSKSTGSFTASGTIATPNMRSKLRSAVLVRTDTGELLPHKDPHRIHVTSFDDVSSTASPCQRTSPNTKRKNLSADTTPGANSSSKRTRLVHVTQTVPQPRQEGTYKSEDHRDVGSSPCGKTPVQGHDATLRKLKTTPPWCQWPGQLESSHTTRSTPAGPSKRPHNTKGPAPSKSLVLSTDRPALNSGQPLAEIENLSPDRSRQLRHNVNEDIGPAKERRNLTKGPASPLRKRLQAAAASEGTRMPQTNSSVTWLPTPPTSSPLDAELLTGGEAVRRTTPQPLMTSQQATEENPSRSTLRLNPTASGVTPRRTSPRLAARFQALITLPVLLSESLSHLCTHPSRPLDAALRTSKFSFTYSPSCFLDSMTANKKPHFVIVDTARPDAVSKEMCSIMRETHERLMDGILVGKGRIVFLDWTVLRGVDDEKMLKRCFGGCLAFDAGGIAKAKVKATGDTDGDVGNEHIRPIWKWREAFALQT